MLLTGTIKHLLAKRFHGKIRFDEPMADHTTFRIGGPADVFVLPETVDDVMDLLDVLGSENVGWFVFGGGANLLVHDGGIRGVVISPAPGLSGIRLVGGEGENTKVTAQSGASLWDLCRLAAENGLSGLMFAAGIPGTIGGAVMMNAGTAEGDMSGVIMSLEIVSGPGEIRRVRREEMAFSYRSLRLPQGAAGYEGRPGVIVSATVKLDRKNPEVVKKEMEKRLAKRKQSQPGGFSAGSFFKNPPGAPPAGELIDKAGLKGFVVGGAEVSKKHANFIINRKKASAGDVLVLMEIIRKRVHDAFGITLEPEVKIVGEPG
ncbi:MAG: UDP-N-acetylmuramate dehydrogenase [Desulfosalsimonadaceae bacterium]